MNHFLRWIISFSDKKFKTKICVFTANLFSTLSVIFQNRNVNRTYFYDILVQLKLSKFQHFNKWQQLFDVWKLSIVCLPLLYLCLFFYRFSVTTVLFFHSFEINKSNLMRFRERALITIGWSSLLRMKNRLDKGKFFELIDECKDKLIKFEWRIYLFFETFKYMRKMKYLKLCESIGSDW